MLEILRLLNVRLLDQITDEVQAKKNRPFGTVSSECYINTH
jgi:hypothetical protein